jgi:hypothetical protein
MAKLTVNEAALQGFTDVVTFEAGSVFENDTAAAGTVKTYSVPAGTLITNCSVHKVANFTGGSISDVRLDIGFGGDGSATIDDFIDDADIFDGDEFVKNSGSKLVGGSAARGHLFTADDTIDIEFTPTGDGMDAATTGKVVIKFTLLDVRDPAEIS